MQLLSSKQDAPVGYVFYIATTSPLLGAETLTLALTVLLY